MRTANKPKRRILRQLIPNSHEKYETFYCFSGDYRSDKRGYTLYWIYTTEKRKRDRHAREQRLLRVEQALAELTGKLNTRSLKTKQQITDRLTTLLEQHGVSEFYHIEILPIQERSKQQLGKGRPGKSTRYKITTSTIYSWRGAATNNALHKSDESMASSHSVHRQESECEGGPSGIQVPTSTRKTLRAAQKRSQRSAHTVQES